MKKILLLLSLFVSILVYGQTEVYYVALDKPITAN
jgi:hypothetical protein